MCFLQSLYGERESNGKEEGGARKVEKIIEKDIWGIEIETDRGR